MNKLTAIIILIVVTSITSCIEKFPLKIGENYFIEYDSNGNVCLLDSNNSIIITGEIINFKYDSLFILIEQKPIDLILKEVDTDPKISYKKRKEIVKKSKVRLYWMILKNENKIFGPYNLEEFKFKNREMNKNKNLSLPILDVEE
jgi:hypothetical protein